MARPVVTSITRPRRLGPGVVMNPVPPSSRAGAMRATRGQVDKAAELYERFSGQDAYEVGRVKSPPTPSVLMVIGELDFVGYSTVRDGAHEKYIHKFTRKDRGLLCVDATGKQLYVIGGKYTFTERGIVDQSDPSS